MGIAPLKPSIEGFTLLLFAPSLWHTGGTMKTRQTVITPEGDKATVTEIHRNGKTVKVEMWGRYVNGTYTWPARPFIRVYKPSQLKVCE